MLNLTFELLKHFADGTLPATLVQVLAAAALADGWGGGDPIAEELAAIGSKGQHPQNCLRDLLRCGRHVGMMGTTPEPYQVTVMGPRGTHRTISVVLPREQAELQVEQDGIDKYQVSEAKWTADVGVGRLLQGWGQQVGLDPAVARQSLAFGFHADGVSYSSTTRVGCCRSVNVASWNIISAEQQKYRGKRHLSYAVCKTSLCDCGCEGSQASGKIAFIAALTLPWCNLLGL